MPSRRRAADASRRAVLLLLAIAPRLCLAYISLGRLARRAPRPPGSVRGFVHKLSRGAARRRAATPAREGRQHLLAHALDERRRVAGAARDGLADPDAHPHAPRNGEHVVRKEPPGL